MTSSFHRGFRVRRIAVPALFALLLFCSAAAFPAFAEEGRALPAQERIQAIDGLFSAGGGEASRAILPFLSDRDLAVRSHAVRRLVDLGKVSVPPLVEALSDEDVRWLACGALINIGPDAVPETILATRDRNPVVRRNALFVLRQLDAKTASPAAREALSDPDPSVQVQAIQALARFGGEGALRLLMGKVDSRFPDVRNAAVESLRHFGDEAISALSSILTYGNPDVRAAAIQAMGAMGSRKALFRVGKSLSDDAPVVRYYCCVALGESGDPSFLGDLAARFDDANQDVREAASEACSRMPDASWPFLRRFLKEGNSLQKISATAAVRKAAYRPAVSSLLETLHDPSPEVRVASVAALMVLADPGTVEDLTNSLRDPEVRWISVMALRQIGDRNIGVLLRRSDDPELDYWKQHVLEDMGDKALEGCLEALKNEKDLGVQITTMCTLKQIKDTRAVYPMIRLLTDERLGYVALFVVSRMGEVAVEPLILSLRDESPALRAQAARALGEIGFAGAIRPVRELAADDDPAVRRAAEQALRRLTGEGAAAAPAAGGQK